MTQIPTHSFENVRMSLNPKVITTSYQDITYAMVLHAVCWIPTGIATSIHPYFSVILVIACFCVTTSYCLAQGTAILMYSLPVIGNQPQLDIYMAMVQVVTH